MTSSDNQDGDPAFLLVPRNDDVRDALVQEALAVAATNGLLMRTASSSTGSSSNTTPSKPTYGHAPLSLLPNAFPAQEYVKARRLAPIWNVLVARVAHDRTWLLRTLESVLPHDDFTRRLVEIYQAIDGAGRDVQKVHLGINRSDYMLHSEGTASTSSSASIKQVEINTIASSFGCLSTEVTRLHRYLAQKVLGCTHFFTPSWLLPYNDTMRGLAHGLAMAHHEYMRQESSCMPKPSTSSHHRRRPCVLMIVQPGERNINDQKLLEVALWEGFGIPLHRATLLEIAGEGHFDLQRRQNLLLKVPVLSEAEEEAGQEGEIEVTVAYFRAGYDPSDYPSEGEWKGREIIEMSAAIKCPCISYHLAGTKKVQEALCRPGELERFLEKPADVAAIRDCFMGLYGLERGLAGAEAAVKAARARPEDYVLKPQREGGGHNLYGEELVEALDRLTPEERAAYILMEKIRPPPFDSHFVRDGQVLQGAAVFELGVYGVFLGDGECRRVLLNESVGHLLRTKLATSQEGGVAAGFAVLSSPLLVVSGEKGKWARRRRVAALREFTMSGPAWKIWNREFSLLKLAAVQTVLLGVIIGVAAVAKAVDKRRSGGR